MEEMINDKVERKTNLIKHALGGWEYADIRKRTYIA